MNTKAISFTLNGESVTVQENPGARLVDVLRETLHLTGTKIGCKEGDCGACSILLDGKSVNSCIIPVGKVEGSNIVTIEGLVHKGDLHPLQQAFIDHGAIQCGMCTPGMIISAKSLLDKNPNPTKNEIREGLSGNICRCTGYVKIETAVEKAALQMKKTASENEASKNKGGLK
ncbi:(2Fe-2S)-binding protein [Desulfovibrio litoralis]|uniref:Carbon-monoxide dehydrogenase small subunit n=1 Tax=Desulfovibrio litoralis DSM 11393 TaxID=1121455 RepID=A0A1M7TJ20_9BACT|nr:(2Fe-2S)-binding protein [Desulfovibrio litoralis]SHN70734.1 carbon-monoxide dehydrogenase small subunit [Desulfovibrio litoralis DSM 11393]